MGKTSGKESVLFVGWEGVNESEIYDFNAYVNSSFCGSFICHVMHI